MTSRADARSLRAAAREIVRADGPYALQSPIVRRWGRPPLIYRLAAYALVLRACVSGRDA